MGRNEIEKKEMMKELLATKARNSFKEVGLSMDEHLYNFNKIIHRTFCDQDSLKFLEKLHAFYISLNQFEKLVFINDYLESGRHYRYWYVGIRSKTMYYKAVNKIYRGLKENFYVA